MMNKKLYLNYSILVYYCIVVNLYFIFNGYLDTQHSDKFLLLYFFAGLLILFNVLNLVLLHRFKKEGKERDYLIGIIISTICLSMYIYIFTVDLIYLPLFRLFRTPNNITDILIVVSPLIVLYNVGVYCSTIFKRVKH